MLSGDLELGNIVWLKSGSPAMTIVQMEPGQITCKWIDTKGKEQIGFYPSQALTKTKPT